MIGIVLKNREPLILQQAPDNPRISHYVPKGMVKTVRDGIDEGDSLEMLLGFHAVDPGTDEPKLS